MDFSALKDKDLLKLIGGNRMTIRLLKEQGAPRNSDGTWNWLKLAAFFAREIARPRKDGEESN